VGWDNSCESNGDQARERGPEKIPTTRHDTELQLGIQKADLDDHVVMYKVGVIMAQQYSLWKGLKLFGERQKGSSNVQTHTAP
jgi:hypothetical protein